MTFIKIIIQQATGNCLCYSASFLGPYCMHSQHKERTILIHCHVLWIMKQVSNQLLPVESGDPISLGTCSTYMGVLSWFRCIAFDTQRKCIQQVYV